MSARTADERSSRLAVASRIDDIAHAAINEAGFNVYEAPRLVVAKAYRLAHVAVGHDAYLTPRCGPHAWECEDCRCTFDEMLGRS